MGVTRPPVLAGIWYPQGAEDLASTVDGYLALAEPAGAPAGRPLLAVVPHAGHTYSGPTAGRLFGLLKPHRPETVFILAPNHRVALTHLAVSGAEAFATPLGHVTVDTARVNQLADHPLFRVDNDAHAPEHAVEILLPFLQRLWPDAPPAIVPVLVPNLPPTALREAGHHLAAQVDPSCLLLVSSDFTHFGDAFGFNPFHRDIPGEIERLDSGAILRILAGDGDGLLAYGVDTGITMCGLNATAVALTGGLPDGYEAALIDYSRSGDRDDDYAHSVSYAGILITDGKAAHD